MGNKSKKGLLMSILWTLVIITAVASSVAMTQSAKVATIRFEQTWTYDAPENVQVTFNAGEGYFSNSQHTYTTTIKINTLSGTSIFPANPTRTGYTFSGYEYSVDGTNYNDYTLASDMPFTDHLYARAKWTARSYSITYRDAGDTSFSGSHAPNYPISHTYGTATTLKTASKTGYSFGGWYTSSSCTGTAVTSLGATAYTNNITLYAKWSANNYSITYYDEGGSGFTGTHASGYPTSHSYGTATTLLSPTKEGYSFGGWYTSSACTGDAVTSLGATTYTSNISLYAKWEEVSTPSNTYTLSWVISDTINNSIAILLSTGGYNNNGGTVFFTYGWGEYDEKRSESFQAGTTIYIHINHETGWANNVTWTLTTPTSTIYQTDFSNYVVGGGPMPPDEPPHFGSCYDVYETITLDQNCTLTFSYSE